MGRGRGAGMLPRGCESRTVHRVRHAGWDPRGLALCGAARPPLSVAGGRSLCAARWLRPSAVTAAAAGALRGLLRVRRRCALKPALDCLLPPFSAGDHSAAVTVTAATAGVTTTAATAGAPCGLLRVRRRLAGWWAQTAVRRRLLALPASHSHTRACGAGSRLNLPSAAALASHGLRTGRRVSVHLADCRRCERSGQRLALGGRAQSACEPIHGTGSRSGREEHSAERRRTGSDRLAAHKQQSRGPGLAETYTCKTNGRERIRRRRQPCSAAAETVPPARPDGGPEGNWPGMDSHPARRATP
jgi:hypothetical protein